MTAGTGTDAEAPGRPARREPRITQGRTLPPDVRALSPMSDPDDVDLTIASDTDTHATPERWMRVAAEDFFRARSNRWMLRGLLGLRLAPAASPDHLGGWTIAENDRDHIRLEARSWMMDAHLVLRVEPDGASIASFVGYRHPIARLVWGRVVAPSHRAELRSLLGQAAQRLAHDGVPGHGADAARPALARRGTPMTAAPGHDAPVRSAPRIAQRRTLPRDFHALSPMADPDDVDLTVVTGTAARTTPERWMRTAFEDEFRSRSGRLVLRGLLQLRLASGASPDHLGGWTIAEDHPDWIRLEARGWMLESHLVLRTEPDGVAVATLVRYHHPIARFVWGRMASPTHREELVRLLGEAAQRLAPTT